MRPVRRNVWLPATVTRPARALEAEEYTSDLQIPTVSAELDPEPLPPPAPPARVGWSTWCAVAVYLSGAVCMLLAAFSKYISSGLFFWPAALSLAVFWAASIALGLSSATEWIWRFLSTHLPHQATPGSTRSTVHSR